MGGELDKIFWKNRPWGSSPKSTKILIFLAINQAEGGGGSDGVLLGGV